MGQEFYPKHSLLLSWVPLGIQLLQVAALPQCVPVHKAEDIALEVKSLRGLSLSSGLSRSVVWEQQSAPSSAHPAMLRAAPKEGPHRVLWELIK